MKAGRGSEQVMIRLPDGMRDRIREAADQAGRSMNAEIVERLTNSFEGEFVKGNYLADIGEKFDQMRGHTDQLVEALAAATQRERELSERVLTLIDAWTQATANFERVEALITLMEKSEYVGQKA